MKSLIVFSLLWLVILSCLSTPALGRTYPRRRRSIDDVCKCSDTRPSCQDFAIRNRDCTKVTGYEAECDHLSDLFNNPFTGPTKCTELKRLKWCISGGILGNERQAIARAFCRHTCACYWFTYDKNILPLSIPLSKQHRQDQWLVIFVARIVQRMIPCFMYILFSILQGNVVPTVIKVGNDSIASIGLLSADLFL